MEIFDTHHCNLRIKLDRDAPEKYICKWKKIKKQCEDGENMDIVEEIKYYCKIESNKNLPYLNRIEGGMGGNNNKTDKQIRFRHVMINSMSFYMNDDDIVLKVDNSDIEKWSIEELDDIIYGLIKTINKKFNTECVKGCIEFVDKKNDYDNYLEDEY